MKLTRKQAIDLSIKKWEWIVENDGMCDYDKLFKRIPEIRDMKNLCPLCEKYWDSSSVNLEVCFKCPIRPKVKNYNDVGESGCLQYTHPFAIWEKNHTKENAEKVLELLKSLK